MQLNEISHVACPKCGDDIRQPPVQCDDNVIAVWCGNSKCRHVQAFVPQCAVPEKESYDTPDYWHYHADCLLTMFVASFVWVLYLRQPRSYFRHMKKAFAKSRCIYLGDPQ